VFDRFLTKDKNMNNIFLYYLDNDIHIIIEFQVTNVNMQTSKTQLLGREGGGRERLSLESKSKDKRKWLILHSYASIILSDSVTTIDSL